MHFHPNSPWKSKIGSRNGNVHIKTWGLVKARSQGCRVYKSYLAVRWKNDYVEGFSRVAVHTLIPLPGLSLLASHQFWWTRVWILDHIKFIIVVPKQFHFALMTFYRSQNNLLLSCEIYVCILLLSFSLIIHFSKPRSKTISKSLVLLYLGGWVFGYYKTIGVLEIWYYHLFPIFLFSVSWVPTSVLPFAASKLQ